MGVSTRKAWVSGLGVLLVAATLCSGAARGATDLQVGSDVPGSIVVFPKVMAGNVAEQGAPADVRDTVITLTNTSNKFLWVHCYYVNTAACAENFSCCKIDFEVGLTARQPTWWRVSTGRNAPKCVGGTADGTACTSDATCTGGGDCINVAPPGNFFGNVGAQPKFQGELKCVELESKTAGGTAVIPMVQNALKGEAVLEKHVCGDGVTDPGPGDCHPASVSAYNGIAFEGGDGPVATCIKGTQNNKSCLGLNPGDTTPDLCNAGGGECHTQLPLDGTHYAACPDSLHVTHYSNGAKDFADGSTVTGELTMVPCTENFDDLPFPADPGNLGRVILPLRAHDQTELARLSLQIPFHCWINFPLDGQPRKPGDPDYGLIYDVGTIGPYVKTRIEPLSANGAGLLGVFEEFHTPVLSKDPSKQPEPPIIGAAAVNLHNEGSRCVPGLTPCWTDAITLERQ